MLLHLFVFFLLWILFPSFSAAKFHIENITLFDNLFVSSTLRFTEETASSEHFSSQFPLLSLQISCGENYVHLLIQDINHSVPLFPSALRSFQFDRESESSCPNSLVARSSTFNFRISQQLFEFLFFFPLPKSNPFCLIPLARLFRSSFLVRISALESFFRKARLCLVWARFPHLCAGFSGINLIFFLCFSA